MTAFVTAANELSVEIQGNVATVTLASPSLRRALQEDLWRTMGILEDNPDVTVIVFTGRRNVFMTGADLGEILALKDRRSAADYLDLPHAIVTQFCNSRKILIAAINGYCLGGGLELALACDFRLVVDHVRDREGRSVPFMGFPEARLGLTPALCGAYFAARIVGPSQARDLFLNADPITSEHALRIGLVDAVVSRELLIEAALQMARKIAVNSSFAMGMTKSLLDQNRNEDGLDRALRDAREAFAACCISADTIARINRFRAERVGNFRGAVGAGRG